MKKGIMDRDDMIYELLELTAEEKLICTHITKSLRFGYHRHNAKFGTVDTIKEILKRNIELLGKAYTGHDGLDGKLVEPEDLLDVYGEQCKEMLDLIRRYSPFV